MKFIVVVLLTTCSFVSFSQDFSTDRKMGAKGKAMVETTMGIYQDSAKEEMISRIGQRLVENLDTQPFPFEFHIVDMGEPNAFALPGGYVFFTRGILALANSEDEMAGVMGHEIIHSYNRHSIKQKKKGILPAILKVPEALSGALGANGISRIFSPLSKGGDALMASHSRKDEYEADELGVKLSTKSGYEPAALGTLLSTLDKTIEVFTGEKEKPSYFDDHPYTPDRVNRINREAAGLPPSTPNKIFKTNKDFLRALDGILVGPNPNQGVFKGDWFIHPDLKFKIQIPEKWTRQNTRSEVAAADSSQSAIMLLEVETIAKTAQDAAQAFSQAFREKTKVALDVKSGDVNGLTSSRVSFTQTQGNTKVTFICLWVEHAGLVYRVIGVASPGSEGRVTTHLESFSSISENDRQSITKKVIRVVETHKGETIKSVSERTSNVIPAKLTAAINGIAEETIFKQGDLVKVVVEVPY
ncbi:MAG: M48 family metalloprotease [Cyclobacteriaceae bacterium]|jgi:predicted Zn-dependent protease|nr:M48 family metalloprotease [Flammeovirgaceae bacterium]